jgi:putative nucleotidyltransferase with HDIG domain
MLELMAHIGTQLGRVVERRRAQSEFDGQIDRLAALRSIDVAILSSMDLNLTLNVVLDQVLGQLRVDAACILQYNRHTHCLSEVASKGFRDKSRQDVERRIDQCAAGSAAIHRRPVFVADLRKNTEILEATPRAENEGFVSYLAVPLVAKGQVKGVLEIFRRSPFKADREVLEFVDALAGQAAIAIDNATLFDGLQRSNIELSLAYDATIEGWARALELRDKETEGHTQRVTELTLVLAQSMGIREQELVHVRWGALLHDIGKVGIPDQILHKPGPLSGEERQQMQLHPVLAYEMLWPIEFLRVAIDIPYYHHEKWDGSGYPHGLQGEQIPLAARIFAVVDVWDALRNERPYKPAWPAAKALEHIRSEAGTHFDPRVVELFAQVVGAQSGRILPAYVNLAA